MEKLKREHKILIVDDTPKNIQVLGSTLAEKGYKIIVATNGKDAIRSLEKVLPDLILLDIMMPEMDGFETCMKIKSLELTSNIPIIFLTAKIETEDIVRAFEIGAVDYITKPFHSAELLMRVHLQLSLKERTDELLESNERNKQLLRVLLHDIRNPVSAIHTITDIAKQDPNIYHKLGKNIRIATSNCLSILENVGKMHLLDNQQLPVQLFSISLKESLQDSLLIFEQKFIEKNLRIDMDIPDTIKIYVDPVSFLHSVFNNLLTNAIKFSLPNSSIHIRAYQKEKQVVLSIKDHGIGMPANILNNIFDPTKTTSRIGTNGEVGTGYGMPLAKKFLSLYGGEIEIVSVEGSTEKPTDKQGTEVTLYIKSGN